MHQSWDRIRSTRVDSGRIMCFSFGPGSRPESKIWEKPEPESLFNFGSGRSLCGHFLSKNLVNLRLDRWLKRSRILKLKNLPDPDPDPDSKILEQERSRSLKKWLRPRLIRIISLCACGKSEISKVRNFTLHGRTTRVAFSEYREHEISTARCYLYSTTEMRRNAAVVLWCHVTVSVILFIYAFLWLKSRRNTNTAKKNNNIKEQKLISCCWKYLNIDQKLRLANWWLCCNMFESHHKGLAKDHMGQSSGSPVASTRTA